MNKENIIESCIELLRSTLGEMSGRDADKIVREVVNILESLQDTQRIKTL